MTTNVAITYINNSMNPHLPEIFLFAKNQVPTFNALKHGVAWKVMKNVGRGSSCDFVYPIETTVQAMWCGSCKTQLLNSEIGQRYSVIKDDTGIVLKHNGIASQTTAIEVNNLVQVDNGIQAAICKDGKTLMTKSGVAYNQKATFILHPKLYWGVASQIQEGQALSSAVLDTDHFFEQNLEGVTQATVTLTGNSTDGYQFTVENQG